MTSSNRSHYIRLKNELLKKDDYNVFLVDWSHKASYRDYFKVVENVNIIGKQIAKFINESRISPMKIHCIGHSLGEITNRIL